MKYMLSAGEASGDLHASVLMQELAKADPGARFIFLGGDRMAAVAGVDPEIHYRRMAFMGFSEVLRHLGDIRGNMARAKALIDRESPDALIVVDYPGFNLPLAKYAHSRGVPVYYYIPPKVWAWKEHRVNTIRRVCRGVFAIFPFEPEFYARHGVEAFYEGNPSVEEIDDFLARRSSRLDFIAEHNLTSRPIIALLPGSRRSEIKNNLPVMTQAVQSLRSHQAVIAAAPGIPFEFYRTMTTLPIVTAVTYDLVANAEAALVTSGTATLETALIGTPQVVCYRANGSRLSYELMKRILKVKHVSLPNLIMNKTIVPEMLLHSCTPALVQAQLTAILADTPGRQRQREAYEDLRRRLGTGSPAANTARRIVDDLNILSANK